MVEPLTQVLGRWMQTTREALRAGATTEDLAAMLQTAADQEEDIKAQLPPECRSDVVYDELPEGLIDLPTASLRYGIKRHTITMWLQRGRLQARGRLKGPAPGGGYVLIAEAELMAYMNAPRDRGGRPRKRVTTA